MVLESSEPVNVTIDKITDSSITLSWRRPLNPKGKLGSFLIFIDDIPVKSYTIPQLDMDQYTQKLTNLKPGTTFRVQVNICFIIEFILCLLFILQMILINLIDCLLEMKI